MPALQIYDPRERALVTAADLVFGVGAAAWRFVRPRLRPVQVHRILLLRLERIGDLVMALPGITQVAEAAPDARIDLAVGSWNREIAQRIRGVDRVLAIDAAWLARGSGGQSLPTLLNQARSWRSEHYDLAINFEPDLRSNLLLAASGARWTVGYASGGGGAWLDQALDYDQTAHTSDNAVRLAAAALGRPVRPSAPPALTASAERLAEADALLAGTPTPRIAMHVPGGRAVKQWPPERFAQAARDLVARLNATIVLTGTEADRPLVAPVRAAVPAANLVDAVGSAELLTVAALLSRCDLMITGDTGPMHIAHAVGTPIVAVFGPSDPNRYGPRGARDRVVRVDLPCAPCNRIRLPPARCTGITPDCLAFIEPDRVVAAALDILAPCNSAREMRGA
jgi:lipopolysaccharide heptosyltransferase II